MTDSPTAFVWTPRLSPGEHDPACWSWPIPPGRTVESEVTNGLSRVAAEMFMRGGSGRMGPFHDGRCAVCGVQGDRLVEDHCHETGQTRAWCCQGCNTAEGRSMHPLFVRYRLWHPAAILGEYQMYTGFGWLNGWPPYGPRRFDQRPATPWPAWDLGMLG